MLLPHNSKITFQFDLCRAFSKTKHVDNQILDIYRLKSFNIIIYSSFRYYCYFFFILLLRKKIVYEF